MRTRGGNSSSKCVGRLGASSRRRRRSASCWRASGARPGCQTSAAGRAFNPNVYYAWLKEFMEAGKTRLAAETVRDATQLEVASLKRDNERLQQLVAELSLEVLVLKKTAIPEFR